MSDRQFKRIHCTINGREVETMIDVRASLTDLLRNDFRLTSVKKGCEVGECGACNVIIDGECFNSCIYLAAWADGKNIRTLESLMGPNGELSDIQQAFIDETAVQCGFCTPGFIMSAVEILESGKEYSREELRKMLSGHLCRCTGYENIINAVEKTMKKKAGHLNCPRQHLTKRGAGADILIGIIYYKNSMPATACCRKAAYSSARARISCRRTRVSHRRGLDVHALSFLAAVPDAYDLSAVNDGARVCYQLPDFPVQRLVRLQYEAVTLVEIGIVAAQEEKFLLERRRRKKALSVRGQDECLLAQYKDRLHFFFYGFPQPFSLGVGASQPADEHIEGRRPIAVQELADQPLGSIRPHLHGMAHPIFIGSKGGRGFWRFANTTRP